MDEKYYKVLAEEALSPCTRFDYSPYLPKGNSAGDWLPKIENASLAEEGYYISKYWNMWYSKGARVYEVDFRFSSSSPDSAVEDQICCGQIRLLRDVTDEVVQSIVDSNFNLASFNTGERNIGSHNTGERNLGNRNTGKLNSGSFNTGDGNTGIDNVGDFNKGSGNVGSRNKGHSNTGDFNVGSYNSGSHNVGNSNTGNFNVGNRNSGKWNIGNYNCGHFNIGNASPMMFGKPVAPDIFAKLILPKWLNKKDIKIAFEEASIQEVEKTLSLPNFDYDIFEKITGISKNDFESKLSKKI